MIISRTNEIWGLHKFVLMYQKTPSIVGRNGFVSISKHK